MTHKRGTTSAMSRAPNRLNTAPTPRPHMTSHTLSLLRETKLHQCMPQTHQHLRTIRSQHAQSLNLCHNQPCLLLQCPPHLLHQPQTHHFLRCQYPFVAVSVHESPLVDTGTMVQELLATCVITFAMKFCPILNQWHPQSHTG